MQKNTYRILVYCFLGIFIPYLSYAQTQSGGSSVYSFLSLPYSARLCALGGDNVAIQDGEISMAMQNPALLCGGTDQLLELNYAHYLEHTNLGSALFGWNFGRSKFELHPDEPGKPNYFAIGIHYLDYGKMAYADAHGELTGGTFTAKDMLIDIMYARQLGPQFTVGVSLKPIMSFYESYSSFALAADVGGHFQTKDSTFQIGLTLRNIGWQLKGFYTEESGQMRESLPFNLEMGLAYRFKHAPIRLSMTIHNMQRWNLNYELTNQPADDNNTKIQWYDMMFRHTIFALDIIPKSDKFYLTISYNHRRRAEMNLKDQRSLAGFGIGAGLRIKMVRVGFAVSQYTKGNLSYQASVSLDIHALMDKKPMVNMPLQPTTSPKQSEPDTQPEQTDIEPATEENSVPISGGDKKVVISDTGTDSTSTADSLSVKKVVIIPEVPIKMKEEQTKQTVIDMDEEVRAVIRGLYGNGIERRNRLGERYAPIQQRVNEIYRQKSTL